MAWNEDFSAFFEGLDSVTATFPGSTDVVGYFEDEYVEADNVSGFMPVFTSPTEDVSSYVQDDVVIINAVNYAIITNEADGTGISKIVLRTV